MALTRVPLKPSRRGFASLEISSLRHWAATRASRDRSPAFFEDRFQSKVSDLLRGKLRGFSVERLLGFLMKLGNDIAISVHETTGRATSVTSACRLEGERPRHALHGPGGAEMKTIPRKRGGSIAVSAILLS